MDELVERGLCPFTFAKPGDRVFDRALQWGIVQKVDFMRSYLLVNFDKIVKQYTLSGYLYRNPYSADDLQDLFWNEDCSQTPMMPKSIADRNEVVTESRFGFGG